MLAGFILNFCSGVIIFFNLQYIELLPQYQCLSGNTWASCKSADFCGKPVEYRVDWQSKYSLHNWVEQLSLECATSKQIGVLGSVGFAGWICTLMFVPKLADTYGRKTIMQTGICVQIVAVLGLLTTHDLITAYLCLFVLGLSLSARITVAFVYMMEMTPQRYKVLAGTLMSVAEVVTAVQGTVWFYFISNYYLPFASMTIVFATASLLIISTLPESPQFLLQKGRKQEAVQAMQQICDLNNTVLTDNFDTFIAPEQSKSESLIADFATFKNICLLSIVWVTVSFNYYLIGLFLKYIPGDIYQNSLASGVSEFTAILSSGLLINLIDAKMALSALFMLSGISGVFLIQYQEGVIIPVLVMCLKFGISAAFNVVYIMTASMFRPSVSARAFGTCNFFARIATIVAPFVAEIPEPVPVIVLSIMCFSASVLVMGISKPEEKKEKECELEGDLLIKN